MLSWGEVGVAEVTGSLQHPDDSLHVTGETETVVGNDQQLNNCRTRGRRTFRASLLPRSDSNVNLSFVKKNVDRV